MTESIGPSYRRVADDIRSKISSGEYAVGNQIPSTVQLMNRYQVSSTVVRQAVERLKSEGILIGHGGKGVFVRAVPDETSRGKPDIHSLGKQVSHLQDEVRRLADRVESQESAAFTRLELNLAELYGKLGFDYPREDEAAEDEEAGSGTAHGNLG